MMGRVIVVLLMTLLAACAPPPLTALPEAAGPWKQSGQEGGSPRRYRYAGPSGAVIVVAVHEYTSDTVAFEAIQKWQVAPGTMPLHQGRRIFVASGAEPAQLREFLTALQPLTQ